LLCKNIIPQQMSQIHQHNFTVFKKIFTQVFGETDENLFDSIENEIEWIDLHGGQILFKQGDKSDSLYITMSGRLGAYASGAGGTKNRLGDIMRGETVGELALFTGEPRSADVLAERDSSLVRISEPLFRKIIASSAQFAINVTKLIINRNNNNNHKKDHHPPVNICLLPAHSTIDANLWANRLAQSISAFGSVLVVSSYVVDKHFMQPGISQAQNPADEAFKKVAHWLDEQEAEHKFLIFVADNKNNYWTSKCKRQADQIVLLADAQQSTDITDIEKDGVASNTAKSVIALIHPKDFHLPENTINWIEKRPWLKTHYHLRRGNLHDLQRLGRIISGNAIGLVLAGGGAKGFAHIGVYLALMEENIPIDLVGGTSIGATVAAAISLDKPINLKKHMRKAAFTNPTKDFAAWPMVSLMTGKRVKFMIENAIYDFTGKRDVQMEDSWISNFIISSNFTQARQEIHAHGSLKNNLLASIAIPGLFPPIVKGNDLLIDGGTFNNFPVDVMANMGASKIIGCDFVSKKEYKLEFDQVPGTLTLFLEKFKKKKNRKYRLPSLTNILLNTTILYSSSKRNEAIAQLDLHFNLDLKGVGMTSWKAFDKIVEQGYNQAKETLKGLSVEQMEALRGGNMAPANNLNA